MISKNEVDKLILLYSGNEKKPELEDIQAIFNDNSQLELNKIPQVVFSGNPKKVSIFLKKLFDQGVNPVTILRTMLNYVQRNVDYTARRLHDTPQNVVYFGNANIEF